MPVEVDTETLEDATLGAIVRRLVAAYHPLRIYLFGSRARGTARTDSDYDLLIIVRDDAPAELRGSKLAYRSLWRIETAKDVLVCTDGWFRSRLGVRTSLPATVARDGKLLYAA